MGFKAPQNHYKLIFAAEDMRGLEVIAKSVPLGRSLEIQRIGANEDSTELDRMEALAGCLGDALISWNLEDEDGTPVPANRDGLMAQDPSFFWTVLHAWTSGMTGVTAPLDDGSISGANALEASIPMDALSPSLSS